MDPNQGATPKQQVVESIRAATNVLVTVSSNPSVDQLAACIGLTLMLNKLGKHATAVFSGQIPDTLEFLRPEDTIEKNTDSLRDFIISLDRSKADKLRYKVEENVVKIFITPYRTALNETDLNFSQGDFNVDVVVGLGVSQREQLDQAIMSHGRILHDARVVTLSAGPVESDLGSINWSEQGASSLCEMLVSISESFQGGLLDGQIATAFLTGIVAETARFSNPKTSPKVMTMAAQLMAAGANQQLIATELSTEVVPGQPGGAAPATKTQDDGSLTISHGEEAGQADVASSPAPPVPPPGSDIHIDDHGNLKKVEDAPSSAPAVGGERVIEPLGPVNPPPDINQLLAQQPQYGGTFNSNTGSQPTQMEQSVNPLDPSQHQMYTPPSPDILPPPQPTAGMTPPGMPQPVSSIVSSNQSPSSILGGPVQPPVSPAPVVMPPAMPQAVTPATPFDQPVAPPPQTPEEPDQTLLDLEKAVDSPHLKSGQSADVSQNVNAARDAVDTAIDAMPYDAQHPEPLQAMNAVPMATTMPGFPVPPDPTFAPPAVSLMSPPNPLPSQQDGGLQHPTHSLLMAEPYQPISPTGDTVLESTAPADPNALPDIPNMGPTGPTGTPGSTSYGNDTTPGAPPPLPPPIVPPPM